MFALRARYVFPVDRPPLRDAVVVVNQSQIVAVGGQDATDVRDLGNVAILPGLVNPHTHLEFSDLRQPLGTPGMAFPDWIRLVVRSRRERPAMIDSIARGISESSSHGVTTLGEIASTAWRPENPPPLEITEFVESIGLKAYRIAQKFLEAQNALLDWTNSLRPGISPHAPYSVHPELLHKLVGLSAERKIPVAHHLAESREELQLMRDGSGQFVQLLKDFEVWDPEAIPVGSRPLEYLKELAKAHRVLVIHGNYLGDEEIEFLAAHGDRMSVVFCPRTHAFFRHDPYPLSRMLAAGVNVAIGTDSRASTPDLNPLAEMRFAAGQHPDVSPANFLQMITSSAAKALGRGDEIGTLSPGKFADLAIVKLPDHDTADPHQLLLESESRTMATIFRGTPVYGESLVTAGSS